MEHEYLTLKEVVSLLRVSEQTVYKMVQENNIPAVRFGGTWRVPRGRLMEYLNKDLASQEQVIQVIKNRMTEIEKVKEQEHRRFNSIAGLICGVQLQELQFCLTLLKGGITHEIREEHS